MTAFRVCETFKPQYVGSELTELEYRRDLGFSFGEDN